MGTQALSNQRDRMPYLFNDFFKPWNEWFDHDSAITRAMSVPAVNITELKNEFEVTLAVPGMKKSDFKIDVDGNMLTISSEKEESSEEKEKKFTRKEYSYSSFCRTFSLPEEVNHDKIEAKYEDGILNVTLPRIFKSEKLSTKKIAVK